MAVIGLTVGSVPSPQTKIEYSLLSIPILQPGTDEMDVVNTVAKLNKLAEFGWSVVACVRMSTDVVYTLCRTLA